MYTIYGLVDPRTYGIRYVGLTGSHPEVRLQRHLIKEDGPKGSWIAELLQNRLKPSTVILDFAPDLDSAFRKEAWWIKHGLMAGWELTNQSSLNDKSRKYPTSIEDEGVHRPPPRPTRTVSVAANASSLFSNEEIARLWLSHHADGELPRGWSSMLAKAIATNNNDLPNWESYKSEAARWKERYHPTGAEYRTYQPVDGWPKPHGWPPADAPTPIAPTDIFGHSLTVLDTTNPADADFLATIRQEIANGNFDVRKRK